MKVDLKIIIIVLLMLGISSFISLQGDSVTDELQGALENMDKAQKKLGDNAGKDSVPNQKKAREHMKNAQDLLDEQLLDLKINQTLKRLLQVIAVVEKLLKNQLKVNEQTNTIKGEIEATRRVDREIARTLKNLAKEQKTLSSQAKEITSIFKDGLTPYLTSEMTEVSTDMYEVSMYLGQKDVNDYVVDIQTETVQKLNRILSVLKYFYQDINRVQKIRNDCVG